MFIDPIDEQVYLPIDGLKMLMQRWQVDDSITVAAATLPTVEPQAVGSAVSKTLAPAATLPTYKGVPILPGDRTTLLNRLKEQCPELLKLVKSPPIRLVGLQRTGKSTFACKLALLRALLLEGHTTLWATPHREINNRVPEVLNPIGTTAEGAKDFAAIEAHWSTIQAQIDQGQPLNLTAVWDEFGDYDQFQNTDLLGSSLRSLLRESTKHGYFPVLVVHGDQASFLPGVKNILTTLQQSTIKVETIGEQANEFGEMKPTGWVQITWLDGTQSAFKTPEWLTVEYLLTLVRSNTKPVFMAQLKPESKPVQSTPKSHGSERDRLEQLFGKSPADLVDNQESEQVVRFDLFEELARVMTPVDPMFADFVLWLKTKQGQTLSKRDMILLWGNKKDRGVASNEKIQPFIDKAIANTLLAEVDGSYRVFNHVV
ncbi:MAG TPA: hypothetical protein IGS53_04820 [Leptolyngbyaceae cyanobacterium M33_DOE_097]|uniref:Uncharacterized protein n=1 Tax=Oscillatoriales cyanobacterium SpSt-418 TaxID=2282169 RepID=A0A7C3KG80_9CYAN|nr:hypothetical protein [Leptolyngbyaceae cyanobacterium M33_DOE_097]